MTILLILSLLALIVTKAADVLTTVRGINRCGGMVELEKNPLARWVFRCFGLRGGIVAVMVLWAVIVAVCYVPAFAAPLWYQAATAVGGGLIAWAQGDVARANATGRHSAFTRLSLQLFQRMRRPRGR